VKDALQIDRIVSAGFEENTFVARLQPRTDCLVVDPGLEPQKTLAYLDEHRLTPAAILNTHGHGDHIGGNGALKERWPQCPLVIGRADAQKLVDPDLNLSAAFGFSVVSPAADMQVDQGSRFSAAGFDLEVLAIPGHSVGHVVYLWRGQEPYVVFVGDVIFFGSIGRTDFPDGDFNQLVAGIREKLYTLPDATRLLPGHGPATTVGREKRTNPFVPG
jgi:glyoxylase-like metal-dependent hydrolase (beta-lactamase superfamily II)